MNLTFSLIKPGAMQHCEEILMAIKAEGFSIIAMKTQHLTFSQVEIFYKEHRDKSFFHEMCEGLTQGPVLLVVIHEKKGIETPLRFRTLLGATNPKEALPGTLRARFGVDINSNAVHGSDSKISAIRELSFFFSGIEIGFDITDYLPL
ncbi:nucleoside-diphosphate kinase [Holospora curviuscula]|uniref:Nucleoside diphosphate kinase n=1 Tax=Holospora curviuscula TaxID=1082868 RepID=A0A2S5R7E8_9PROT|nr:nucleoside-diphosphate kinase [Holospora curviuscula]PPE03234.1 Nucleoside diphosphate kinase [Holospora curviuscula]